MLQLQLGNYIPLIFNFVSYFYVVEVFTYIVVYVNISSIELVYS